jgi:DNA-binding LacI/PurR family transcriptional regulator
MYDIALELGLSKSTVSRALSDSGRISIETKEKVRACAKKHGFKPNLVAKALAGQKNYFLIKLLIRK